MGLFGRLRRAFRVAGRGNDPAVDLRYCSSGSPQHTGVEAYVEPKTTVTDSPSCWWPPTASGRVAGPAASAAQTAGGDLQIPVYDVQKAGYPQRMRDHDARRRIERQRALREELESDPGQPLAAMSSSTANIVRTGTPVPPLPV